MIGFTLRSGALLGACAVLASATAFGATPPRAPAAGPFTLHSPNFRDGGRLPAWTEGNNFGCKGPNTPPLLTWSGVPAGTKSLALTVFDPDAPVAGGFHHWIIYNIPITATALTAAVRAVSTEGTNDTGGRGYFGPCPPPTGQLHHYNFVLYALSVRQVAGRALTYNALLTAIASHVLGATDIIGTFRRG